ncbi:MAG: hypothetical protein IPN34_18855 [Planctomycetes bacterium]|nr:hypothetical protein [Planctomycetota bacterium]
MDGRATIFEDCLRPATNLVSIVLQPPVQENCDHYRIRIKVSALGWTLDADFRAKYCRTWMDFDAQGQCRQRWRFLLNADVDFVFDELNPPPLLDSFVPFCVAAGGSHRPHYTGHVDYVCTEVDGVYAAAIEIHHLPGCISHATCAEAPASTVPAPFQHLNESLHIAGPLPFSFADPGVFPGGPGNLFPFVMTNNPGDKLRESRFPWSSYACLNESSLVPGIPTFGDQPGQEICACARGEHCADRAASVLSCGPISRVRLPVLLLGSADNFSEPVQPLLRTAWSVLL